MTRKQALALKGGERAKVVKPLTEHNALRGQTLTVDKTQKAFHALGPLDRLSLVSPTITVWLVDPSGGPRIGVRPGEIALVTEER